MAHPFPSRNLPPFTDVLHTIVVPLEKRAHLETIDPTIIDYFMADVYIPVLFAYRLAEKSDAVYSQTVKRIKESLSKVLVPFFSFAGRWVPILPESPARRKLMCNDMGVPFIEAYLDADLDSVVQASTAFQPVPELHGHSFLGMDVTQFYQQLPPDGAPPILVQVTRFKCGGLVLGVTFNHLHVDGQAFFKFIRAWSDISRANETAVKVDDNRAHLDGPFLRALFPDPAVLTTFKPAAKLGPWGMKSFEVGASTIKVLKEEAKSNSEGPGYVSTGDCILAQLLRGLDGLRSSVVAEQEFAVTRTIEGRARFYDPPVPDVCANVTTLLLPPQIPTGELLEMPLVSIASKFRDKLETPKREEWLRSEVVGKTLQALGKRKNFMVSSWFTFGLYEMDFGFGNPYYVVGLNTDASMNILGTAIILPPIPSSSSSVATLNIWTTDHVLQALESDPQFLQFFLVH